MQPSDNTPAPQPPKQGFWAKLFGKKPETPVVPPHESLTPPPQLDENTPASSTQSNLSIGTPESKDLSAPDGNGDITSLPVDVPSSILSSAEGVEGTPPTLPVEQPAPQSPAPVQPVAPQSAFSTPPTTPVTPAPPVQPQSPVQPQPPQPGQQQ
jgi:hypothetical protein